MCQNLLANFWQLRKWALTQRIKPQWKLSSVKSAATLRKLAMRSSPGSKLVYFCDLLILFFLETNWHLRPKGPFSFASLTVCYFGYATHYIIHYHVLFCRTFVVYPQTKIYFSHWKDLSPGSAQVRKHGLTVMQGVLSAVEMIDDLRTGLLSLSELHAFRLRVDPSNFKVFLESTYFKKNLDVWLFAFVTLNFDIWHL